jgi:hypothetical protein
MKITTTVLMSVFIVLGLACSAFAEDAKPYEIEISVGGSMNDLDDEGSRVAEYDSTAEKNLNLILGGKVSYTLDKVAFDVYGEYLDGDDQAYGANLDLDRILMLETDYLRFFHRLDHDNLNHVGLDGPSSLPLSHSDFNAGDDYGITRSEWKSQSKLNIPMVPGLSFAFNHRFEERKGMDQALTRTMSSRCVTCHAVGMSKDISETTNEWNPSVNYRIGPMTLNYDFLYRSFNSGSDVLENPYMEGQQPETTDGSLPFSRTPDSEKWSHKIKVKADLPADNTVNLGYVYSKAKNNDSDSGGSALYGDVGEELKVDYWALNGGWHWKINRTMGFTLKGKYHDMDADEAYVDDVTRYSAYDENEYSADAKFAWKVLKDLKLKLGYEVEYLDRENAEYHNVTDDTTTHKFSIGSNWRPAMGLKVSADYAFTYVDDPYVYHDPMWSSWEELQGFDTTSEREYWFFQYVNGRIKDRSNQPETVHDMRLKAYWVPTGKINSNIHLRYKLAENSEVGGSDWEQDMFNGGINVMYSLMDKIEINFGYNYFYDKYEAMFCSAFYNGWLISPSDAPSQLGGQSSDNYEYETETHTFYVGANASLIPERWDISAVYSFTKGTANIQDLGFGNDPFAPAIEGRTGEYSFTYINGSNKYSDLEYIMLEVELTTNISITDQLGLTFTGRYSDFNDQEEYVYDELDGSLFSLSGFVTYRF